MRKLIQILCLLVISMLISGMAQAGILSEKRNSLTKVKASSISSFTMVEGLETYYGDSFAVSEISGEEQALSLNGVMSVNEISLTNGETFSPNEIEYAYVRTGKAPQEKAPQEKSPHDKAPQEKAPQE